MGGEVHLDIYDDRLVFTSPGGMYSGQLVQELLIEEVSSMRRNPVLADVMAQLDYMEKRGSGLKKICNATKELDSYKEERKPVFKSSISQFMTVIYSMEYSQTGEKTGNDTGKDTGNEGTPDQYVFRLLEIVGNQTLTVKRMMEILKLKGDDNFRKTWDKPLSSNDDAGKEILLVAEKK